MISAKDAYVRTVRRLRAVLRRTGLLGRLELHAPHSRTAHWVRSWFAIYDLDDMLSIGVPWWTYAAIDEVEAHLTAHPDARVFEWGSGASTVWLAGRSTSVVAVEHDTEWAGSMASHVPGNVQLQAVPPVRAQRPGIGSLKPGFEGLDFTDYVAALDSAEGVFDVVVVDGRAREACVVRALDRLASDGIIVFDNVDRRRYRDAIARLGSEVEVMWTRGRTPSLPYPTQTALLRRSKHQRE